MGLSFLYLPHPFYSTLTLPSSKILMSTLHIISPTEIHSRKHSIFPLSTPLLGHIPLDLPFCSHLRVRGMLQCSGNLPLPLHTEHALPYIIIDLCELAAAHFGANYVLQLDCCELQLVCTQSSIRSGSLGTVMNAPIRGSRILSSSVIRYTGVRI